MSERDPRVLALLDGREPVAVAEVEWARRLRISAYLDDAAPLSGELVVSVRCVVLVGDDVVVCTNAGGDHPWPGGRREPGQTYAETACREVHEETGWWIVADSIVRLGFLHLFNAGEPLPPYPHPDVLQLVVTASATDRAADDWTDVEGHEISSRLVPLGEAAGSLATNAGDALCVPFLEHLVALRG